jgi:palmitoyltransferase
MFAGGMAMTSMSFVFKAVTTIDNIGHQRRVMHLAVLIEDPSQNRLPRPMSSASTDQMFGAENSEDPWQGIITYPLNVMPDASSETTLTPRVSSSSPPLRTFAILRTHAGMNPWNLGPFRNFKAIMGNHWFDWVLPLRQSPCCDHDRGDSMYELGPDVEQLKIDAGLSTLDNRRRSSRRRHRKNRHLGEDDEDLDNMGSTLANVNGSTGRDRGSYESI